MSYLLTRLRAGIAGALRTAIEEARPELGLDDHAPLPDFSLEIPREKNHGDFATNVALLLTKAARKPPRQIAETLQTHLISMELQVDKIDIAGPGFINFHLHPDWLHGVLPEIRRHGAAYGKADFGQRQKVQVEFVSANPTGLLHMGNARGAAIGDSIAALLEFVGFQVSREFYVNDAGLQIEKLVDSLEARYFQALGEDYHLPEDGYQGQELIEAVEEFAAQHSCYREAAAAERRKALCDFAIQRNLTKMRTVLAKFGVNYDRWFSEQDLYNREVIDQVLEELRHKDFLYEHEGAWWFRATHFNSPKDEVVVRSNGLPTYFTTDIAYHKDKFDRGFSWLIDVWGTDHHGHVSRLKGALSALGYDAKRLDVVLMQLVRLYRDGQIVRMSKRTGEYITLDELIEEVGPDAARYFFVTRSADSHLDFDLDLAKRESNENPVYYIQYAHARICSIFQQVEERGKQHLWAADPDLSLLGQPEEQELLRKLADFPEEVLQASTSLAPHRIAQYVLDLAGLFHSFYNAHHILNVPDNLGAARLLLAQGTHVVLKNATALLGVSAPDKM